MRIIIFTIASLVCAGSFAATIDKTALTWEDSKGSFLLLDSQTHQCEIKTDKNRFVVSRHTIPSPKKKVSISWNINIIPNLKRKLPVDALDQYTMSISFLQATTNTYQIDLICVVAPDKLKLDKKREETAIVGFGYQVKQCKMMCDDFQYSVGPSVFKAFGKNADLMLNTRTFNIKYKNDKGKPVKSEFDLSELKSVYEILQEEAKKYNEVIEFKFHTKADSNS